jgi:hypothetical protein
MLSLYDYLGHAAGPELGKQVAEYAKIKQAPKSQRHVENIKYKGVVYLYTKEFLDEFFKVQSVIGTNR